MRKIFILLVIFFFYLCFNSFASDINVSLNLSPEKSKYTENEPLKLLFSLSSNKDNLKGDIYIVFLTPDNDYYSITLKGVVKGISPLVRNLKIIKVDKYPVFNFPYLSIFKTGGYKILSAVVDSYGKIESNIYTLNIPGEIEDNNTSPGSSNDNTTTENSILTWNPLKKIYKDHYRPFAFIAGTNYLHLFTYKSNNEVYYFKFDKSGNIITAAMKIPFEFYSFPDYLPAIVVDKNDNIFILYFSRHNTRGIYLSKIKNNGEIEFNKLIYKWTNTYFPKNFSAAIYKDNIYFTGSATYLTDYDENDYNKKTVYYRCIFLCAVTTDGDILFQPSAISAQVKEYYKGKKIKESDELYTKLPVISVDNQGIVHLFWNEKNITLKTNYFLKYFRFNPINGNSFTGIITEIGKNYSHISVLIDNNSIFAGFKDNTLNPPSISIVKLSTDGKLLKTPFKINTGGVDNEPFYIFKKGDNLLINYYYNHNTYEMFVNSALDRIVEEPGKITNKDLYYHCYCQDSNGNLHMAATDFGSNNYLYYSNTISHSNLFRNLPDIVLSEGQFSCTPSNNVNVGDSISCSFEVFNISDNQSSDGNVNVKIDGTQILSKNIGSLSPFESKKFTFEYSPDNVNTPEFPNVVLSVQGVTNELSDVNNKITPVIHVRPVPTDTTVYIKVYDESFDEEHQFYLPRINDAVCKLYDKSSGEFVSTAVSNKFLNVPIGKSYIIKCEKSGYNIGEQEISIQRDSNDPYKIDISPYSTVPIYLNTWGNLTVEVSYIDENNEEKPVTNIDLYITGNKVNKHIKISSSPAIISNLPSGTYRLKLEKENYKRIEDNVTVSVGGNSEKNFITEKTDIGDIKIKLSSNAGYIPTTATAKFTKSNSTSEITISNGVYTGSMEKGTYSVEITASDFKTYKKNFTIKAGLLNEMDVELEAATPSNLKSYNRSENVAVVPYAILAEWPSTPISDGYKVKTMFGVFTINLSFLGEEQDNKIYSLKQMGLSVKGLGAYYYSVETTWDPLDIIDLPETAQNIYDAYGGLPFAVTPEIPLGITGFQGKTKIRIDKIIIKDNIGTTLATFDSSIYSDCNYLFNVNKILNKNVDDIIAEIYLKVGESDTLGDFKDISVLDGYNTQYLKLTYTVPLVKPESGWYFYNPVTGNVSKITSNFGQSVSASYLRGTIQYKAFKPYKINLEYVNSDYYVQNILNIPAD